MYFLKQKIRFSEKYEIFFNGITPEKYSFLGAAFLQLRYQDNPMSVTLTMCNVSEVF